MCVACPTEEDEQERRKGMRKKSLPPTLIAPLLVGFGAFRIAAGFVAVPAFC